MDHSNIRITVYLLFTGIDSVVINVLENSAATIHCPLNIQYPPWTGPEGLSNPLTDGQNITEQGIEWVNSKDLKIVRAMLKHDGNYTCSDGIGSSETVELDVIWRVTVFNVTSYYRFFNITCPLEALEDPNEFPTWFGPHDPMKPLNEPFTNKMKRGGDNGLRWIDNKTIMLWRTWYFYRGTYTCEDKIGNKASTVVRVMVFTDFYVAISPAIATEENNQITITCSVYSFPRPTIEMQVRLDATTENITVDSNRFTRTFTASKRDNGREQNCTFNNIWWPSKFITRSAMINFEFPPTAVRINGNKPINSGSDLDLTCSTDSSNPVSTITWRQGPNTTARVNPVLDGNYFPIITDAEFNGKSINDSITIMNLTNEMNGQYVFCCVKKLCDNVTLDITSTGFMVTAWMVLLVACIACAVGSNY